MNKILSELISKLASINEIEAVFLSGSMTGTTSDENSDYDIYIYADSEVSLEKRKSIMDEYFCYMEYDNRFWETEDDGILKDSNETVEFIYRGFDFLESEYNRLFNLNCAYTGFSTCIWHNVKNSEILFDRNGRGKEIIEKFRKAEYPEQLRKNIIAKNLPLLDGTIPAYIGQIEKAVMRDDFVSVNHRVAAFLASYFDIIFAVNKQPHPGEKKLLRIIDESLTILPEGCVSDIKKIIRHSGKPKKKLVKELKEMVNKLRKLLNELQ